jgi:hypothetical protein
MYTPPRKVRPQDGAVAIVFSLTLVALLAVGGLVLDLSHLYVLKSELQNGADSAALAGAREINLSAAGVTNAANKAIAFAGKNKYNFGTALALSNADISFGSKPDGPWSSVSEAIASPSNKSFIKVDTSSKTVSTYLMNIVGINSVATSGVAVAGRFVVDVTPLGVCAKDLTKYNALAALPDGRRELTEFGFRRGYTYNILELGAVAGSPSDPMMINPVDSPPTACSPSNSNVNFTAPFLCQGNSALAANAPLVYANTGAAKTPTERALNSRFDDYPGGTSCIAATSPPDPNIHEYDYSITAANGGPGAWMTPAPTAAAPTVLWSYAKAAIADGSAGSYSYGGDFAQADWPALYGKAATGSYPATGTPYSQTAGSLFHQAPDPGHTTGLNRRVLNMVIVDCSAETSNSMACRPLPVVGTGRFFMQSKANLNGGSPYFFVEFAGLIAPVPNSEIKLYR